MTDALVAHTQIAGSATGGTSSAINTTGASLLVAVVTQLGSNAQVTPTDSFGNTYVALTRQPGSGDAGNCIFYVANPTVGSGHTFTATGAGDFLVTQILAFSGVITTSPFDVQNGTSTGSGTTVQPGSVTPSQAGSLVIVGFSANSTSATNSTINSGFTITDQAPQSSGVNFAGGAAYLIQTAASAVNPTWTNATGASQLSATIAVFKPAAGSFTGTLTDTAGSSDAVSGALSASAAVSDASATSDLLTSVATLAASLTDGAVSNDGLTSIFAVTGAVADTIAASDAVSASLAVSAALPDAVATTDAYAGLGAFAGAWATSAGAIDGMAGAGAQSAAITDMGATTDTFFVPGGNYAGSWADVVTTSDAFVVATVPYPPFTPAPQRAGTIPGQSRFGVIPRHSRFGVIP